MMGLFGRSRPDPKEQVRELKQKMRSEINALNRQICAIEREEMKVKTQIKEAAKKNNKDVCIILAKSIVQSRKAVAKLHMSNTQIKSIIMNMDHQLSAMRMAGSIKQSTDVMRTMQQLVKVPEIMQTMREMSKEMAKVGIMEEMIEDTMDSLEPEELEEQAQDEVDKILWEVTAGALGHAPTAVRDQLAEGEKTSISVADDFIRQMEDNKN